MIHMSEWYVFLEEGSSLRQRDLYSDDCNRLQQTATDCNGLQQKEGSSLRQRALYSDDCNRLQQTATERRLIFASKSLVFR